MQETITAKNWYACLEQYRFLLEFYPDHSYGNALLELMYRYQEIWIGWGLVEVRDDQTVFLFLDSFPYLFKKECPSYPNQNKNSQDLYTND